MSANWLLNACIIQASQMEKQNKTSGEGRAAQVGGLRPARTKQRPEEAEVQRS